MKRGDADAIFTAAGDLAHFAADLHMPLHVTKNYNGQLTGNKGIHKMLEVGLAKRYASFYAEEVVKGRTEPAYLADPQDRLFDWLIAAAPAPRPFWPPTRPRGRPRVMRRRRTPLNSTRRRTTSRRSGPSRITRPSSGNWNRGARPRPPPCATPPLTWPTSFTPPGRTPANR